MLEANQDVIPDIKSLTTKICIQCLTYAQKYAFIIAHVSTDKYNNAHAKLWHSHYVDGVCPYVHAR